MPQPASPYHHGNLPNTLVDTALGLLASGGMSAVSLRAVARAAGVSAMAPYNHFAGHDALLAAIAVRGFGHLCEARSTATNSSAMARVAVSAGAHVRFAQTDTALFRLMFSASFADRAAYPELAAAAAAPGEALLALVRATHPGDPVTLARLIEALAQGIALGAIDGYLAGVDAPALAAKGAWQLLSSGGARGG